MEKEHKGFLFGIAGTIVNALLAVVIKFCNGLLPNETMVFTRFFISFLLVVPAWYRGKVLLRVTYLPKHLVRSCAGLISIYCYYYGLEYLPLANAMTLANTMPLFTPFVLIVWMRVLVSRKCFYAAAIGFLGVIFMMRPTHFAFQVESFIALGTGLCAAIAFIGVRQLSKVENTETILFYYFGIASIVSFFPFIVTLEPIVHLWLFCALILMGLLSSLFQYCMTKAFSLAPASRVGIVLYLAIGFSMLFGWAIWKEVPGIWGFIGMGLTVVGGVIAAFEKTPPRPLSSFKK